MVRCDDFYRKWQKAGNFCEKHPKTAALIEEYLEKIIPLLEDVSTESEILNDASRTIVPELSEGASRPLIQEKSPEVRREVMEQIVKVAEEKVINGKRPQVTNREVCQIIEDIKGPQEEPIPSPDPMQVVQQLVDDLGVKADMPAIPKYLTDLLDFKEIRGMLEELTCPCCGMPATGNLVWKCCGSTLDDAIEKAEAAVDKRFEEINAASKARREAVGGY